MKNLDDHIKKLEALLKFLNQQKSQLDSAEQSMISLLRFKQSDPDIFLKNILDLPESNEINSLSDLDTKEILYRKDKLKEIERRRGRLIDELRMIGDLYKIENDEIIIKFNIAIQNELLFFKELKFVILETEKKRLKKLFQQIDENEEVEIPAWEIKAASINLEKKRLKEKFKKLDEYQDTSRQNEILVAESKIEYGLNKQIKKSPKRLYWKPLAIAASMVGVIVLVGFLFILREGKFEKDQIAKNMENELLLFGKENNLVENSRDYKVLDSGSDVQYDHESQTNDKSIATSIKVVIRDVKSLEDMIDFKKSFLIDDTGSINRNALDSLNSLQKYLQSLANTYTYKPEEATATLNLSGVDSVFGVFRYPTNKKKQSLYIKISGLFYKIKAGKKPMPLQPLTDNELIKVLEKVSL